MNKISEVDTCNLCSLKDIGNVPMNQGQTVKQTDQLEK